MPSMKSLFIKVQKAKINSFCHRQTVIDGRINRQTDKNEKHRVPSRGNNKSMYVYNVDHVPVFTYFARNTVFTLYSIYLKIPSIIFK